MTKKELSQYYWLKREIEEDEKRLRLMRERAYAPKSQRLTGMPGGGTPDGDRMAEIIAEITDLEAIIAAKRIQCIHECQRIERFIHSIPDSMTRMVFTYRCIECMTWREVAAHMGHMMSEENARQLYSRYLKTASAEEEAQDNE